MPKSKQKHLPFEAFLEADAALFDYRIAEYGQGCASTKEYNFRYDLDEVQIGVKANFDRWANSVDFVCRPIPATQEDYDALKAALAKVIAEKRSSEDGSFDIWPFVRKMRREKRSNERLAAKHAAPEEVCA